MGYHQIIRNFSSFGGLDLRTSELIKERVYATYFLNAQQKQSTAVEKRAGTKALMPSGGSLSTAGNLGFVEYGRVNTTNGQVSTEKVKIGSTLYRETAGIFRIAYSGASSYVLINFSLSSSTNTFHFVITDASSTVLDFDCGTSINEVSFKTLGNLQTAINALTGYTCTIPSGSISFRAALLPITVDLRINTGSSADINFSEWTAVNTTVTAPFSNTAANAAASHYENPSCVNLNGCLYIATGYDDLQKYDGQTLYRAGLPKASFNGNVTLAGTGYTDTNVQYFVLAVQKDAQGNLIYGEMSTASNTVSPTNQTATITVNNILAGSGFNTNCAIVNGNQTTVTTLTVANTNTLQVGDTAYFYDQVSASYVERLITARTLTSITIAGAAVTVSNNDVISNNLRLKLLRTTAGGSFKYELLRSGSTVVVELPNNSLSATQTYADANATRGSQFFDQLITPTLPNKCRYITAHQNLLVMAGDPLNVNTVYFADVDYPEGFDQLRSSFDCLSGNTDQIRGLGTNNEILAIFKTNFSIGSIFAVAGVLQQGQYRVDIVSKNLGCVSHHTIREIEGFLYFLSERGAYKASSGQLPEEISFSIRPVFSDVIPNTTSFYVYRRATSIVDTKNQKYLIFLPDETVFNGRLASGTNSRCYAFDYFRNSWAEWSQINAAAGFVVQNDTVYFAERRVDGTSGITESYVYAFMGNSQAVYYNDHNLSIPWQFGSVWEANQDPSNFKLFLRTKLLSLEPSVSSTFQIDYQFEINYIANVGITNASFYVGSQLYGYGLSAYGSDPYGDPASPLEPLIKNRAVKAKSGRFVLSNSAISQNVVLSGYQMEVAMPYVKGTLKD